jgi:hypothetical protein
VVRVRIARSDGRNIEIVGAIPSERMDVGGMGQELRGVGPRQRDRPVDILQHDIGLSKNELPRTQIDLETVNRPRREHRDRHGRLTPDLHGRSRAGQRRDARELPIPARRRHGRAEVFRRPHGLGVHVDVRVPVVLDDPARDEVDPFLLARDHDFETRERPLVRAAAADEFDDPLRLGATDRNRQARLLPARLVLLHLSSDRAVDGDRSSEIARDVSVGLEPLHRDCGDLLSVGIPLRVVQDDEG